MRRALWGVALVAIVNFAFLSCGGGGSTTPTKPTPPVLTSKLNVIGLQAFLIPGETSQLQALEYTHYGQLDKTANAAWSSSDTSVVTVSSSGLVLGLAPGSSDISAMVDGVTATIGVRVAPSRFALSGQIDPHVAADIIAWNQDSPGTVSNNRNKGTIQRFDLPIRVYIQPEFATAFSDCGQRAVMAWQVPTGLPIVYTDINSYPRIAMTVQPTDDNRARVVVDSVYLDNGLRGVNFIIPTSWAMRQKPGWCPEAYEDTMNHEFGHSLGIDGHPDWGGVMAYLAQRTGLRQPSAREIRMITELYKLPLGAHVNADGTWFVK